MFQSTHPRGVRQVQGERQTGRPQVSIHAPAWGATLLRRAFTAPIAGFQSTHPRGVRPAPFAGQSTRPTGFNPRTRVGCDAVVVDAQLNAGPVSIHAPAWGATRRQHRPARRYRRFQSTHPRGVRQEYAFAIEVTLQFQSTHPRGVRLVCNAEGSGVNLVSIHAPAWGATSSSLISSARPAVFQSTHPRGVRHRRLKLRPARPGGFNPRTRVGCDCSVDAGRKVTIKFQSTHPRGVRLVTLISLRLYFGCFNPRTRVGCDGAVHPAFFAVDVVSIHAPAWGATTSTTTISVAVCVFQSTHPRGVRLSPQPRPSSNFSSFNPRTRVGCDTRRRALTIARDQFQSTHPRGVRPANANDSFLGYMFQSTHPRGVRLFPCFIQ